MDGRPLASTRSPNGRHRPAYATLCRSWSSTTIPIKVRDEGKGAQESHLRRLWSSARRNQGNIVGLWIEQTEGSKFWLSVMIELQNLVV